jgi:hypothetical protein
MSVSGPRGIQARRVTSSIIEVGRRRHTHRMARCGDQIRCRCRPSIARAGPRPVPVDLRPRRGRCHRRLGGRRPGSRNKHGPKAAFRELVAAAQNSEAEGEDPQVAVVGVLVNGLQAPSRKSLGFVKLMMQHGIGREKIDSGPALGPDRRWLGFGKRTLRSRRVPRAVAARDERKGRELVVRDGAKQFVMVKDQATTCRSCQGRGFRYWGGGARQIERCELCTGTGRLTISLLLH